MAHEIYDFDEPTARWVLDGCPTVESTWVENDRFAHAGFDVDLQTLRTHQALAAEREALISALVAFVFDTHLEDCGHEIPCNCAYSPWEN